MRIWTRKQLQHRYVPITHCKECKIWWREWSIWWCHRLVVQWLQSMGLKNVMFIVKTPNSIIHTMSLIFQKYLCLHWLYYHTSVYTYLQSWTLWVASTNFPTLRSLQHRILCIKEWTNSTCLAMQHIILSSYCSCASLCRSQTVVLFSHRELEALGRLQGYNLLAMFTCILPFEHIYRYRYTKVNYPVCHQVQCVHFKEKHIHRNKRKRTRKVAALCTLLKPLFSYCWYPSNKATEMY